MSRIEHHKGKLIPVEIYENEDIDSIKVRLLKEHGYFLKSVLDDTYSIKSLFDDTLSTMYYVHNGIIYQIHDTELLDEEIIEASKNEDGSISYHLMWYNGGAGFDECLDESMDKLKID